MNDSPELVDQGKGCPLIMVALMGRTPVEWIEQPWGQVPGRPEGHTAPRLGDTYHCTEFRARPDDDDDPDDAPPSDPGPPPVAEGQVDMFEVFVEQIVDEVQRQPAPVPVLAGLSR